MRSKGTPSSRAATSATAVVIRWPISTLPERTSTTSSVRTAIQSSTRGLAARLGLALIETAPWRASALPAAPADGRRTGTGGA